MSDAFSGWITAPYGGVRGFTVVDDDYPLSDALALAKKGEPVLVLRRGEPYRLIVVPELGAAEAADLGGDLGKRKEK